MPRDEMLTTYVRPEIATQVEKRADAEDMSTSAYVARLVERGLQAEEQDEIAEATDAEERIEALIAEGRDEMLSITEELREVTAKAGVYSLALWELEKSSFSDQQRQAALSAGAERLRDDLAALDIDVTGENPDKQPTTDESFWTDDPEN